MEDKVIVDTDILMDIWDLLIASIAKRNLKMSVNMVLKREI